MRFFYTKDFPGKQPTGVAAVVVAIDHRDARRKLLAELRKQGMKPRHGFTVIEVTETDGPLVLCDGDY